MECVCGSGAGKEWACPSCFCIHNLHLSATTLASFLWEGAASRGGEDVWFSVDACLACSHRCGQATRWGEPLVNQAPCSAYPPV